MRGLKVTLRGCAEGGGAGESRPPPGGYPPTHDFPTSNIACTRKAKRSKNTARVTERHGASTLAHGDDCRDFLWFFHLMASCFTRDCQSPDGHCTRCRACRAERRAQLRSTPGTYEWKRKSNRG